MELPFVWLRQQAARSYHHLSLDLVKYRGFVFIKLLVGLGGGKNWRVGSAGNGLNTQPYCKSKTLFFTNSKHEIWNTARDIILCIKHNYWKIENMSNIEIAYYTPTS